MVSLVLYDVFVCLLFLVVIVVCCCFAVCLFGDVCFGLRCLFF